MSILFDQSTTPHRDEPWKVLFTRGEGCARIAELVSAGEASRVEGDLKSACIGRRANVLVTARAGSFDLASTIVPHGIGDDHEAPAVVGAVGTGPHSALVAATTARLAKGLGSDALLVTMSPDSQQDAEAAAVLADLVDHAPGADTRVMRADHAAGLLEMLPTDGLLVLGAPGGSWWQRQFFGPGRRLMHAAPAGSVVVRAAQRRCFHAMVELTPLGPLMRAADAAAVSIHPVTPVVEEGRLIGQVRREELRRARPGATVGDLAEAPIMVLAEEPLDAITDLAAGLAGSPVPVVDDEHRLLGGVMVEG